MNRVWITWIVCGYTFSTITLANTIGDCQESEPPQKKASPSLLMEAKLSSSQQLLRGLVTEDFEIIAKASKQLKKIAEAAHWPSSVDEVYQHHSFEFRRQCDKLIDHAEEKDLQAAHFTFLQMTTSCVDCHNYVRPRFKIEKKPRGPIQLIPTDWDRKSNHVRPSPDDSDSKKNKGAVHHRPTKELIAWLTSSQNLVNPDIVGSDQPAHRYVDPPPAIVCIANERDRHAMDSKGELAGNGKLGFNLY